MLYANIKKLVQYGVETGLTPACEKNYTTNLLLDVFKEDEYVEPEEEYTDINLEVVLNALLDEAVKRNLIEDSIVYRDLFDTKLMNCLMPRPAQVQKEFWSRYEKDPQEATDYFYKLSQESNYSFNMLHSILILLISVFSKLIYSLKFGKYVSNLVSTNKANSF